MSWFDNYVTGPAREKTSNLGDGKGGTYLFLTEELGNTSVGSSTSASTQML